MANKNLEIKRVSDIAFTAPTKSIDKVEKVLATGVPQKEGKYKNPFIKALESVFKKVFKRATLRIREATNLSDDEIQQLNDIAFDELSSITDILEEAARATVEEPSIHKVISEKKDYCDEIKKEFVDVYTITHGVKPVSKQSGKNLEYNLELLASKYVEYIRFKKISEPSQSELKDHFEISQSTWSRAQKDSKFWDFVVNVSENSIKQIESEKELLFKVNTGASDQSEKIQFNKRKTMELPLLSDNHSDEYESEALIERKIDIESALVTMSKDQLIKLAKSLSSVFEENILQSFTPEQLRSIIIALKV